MESKTKKSKKKLIILSVVLSFLVLLLIDRDKQKERMWEDNRLSEDEKKMRNPLYKKARESYMRMVLPAMAAWIPFVIVLMYLLDTAENKKLMGIDRGTGERGAGV